MAKIAFSKFSFNKKIKEDIQTTTIEEQIIEVKQYLPVEEKLKIVENVLNQCVEPENGYYNSLKMNIFLALEMVFNYSNITFTDKQKENPYKLYDILQSNGLLGIVIGLIPESEFYYLRNIVKEMADAIYTYRNSAVGVMEAISRDYSDLKLDAQEINKEIANPENLNLLRDVLTKMG